MARTFVRPTVKPVVKKPITRRIVIEVPTIDADTLMWEREVYEADPTGGQPSRY